jgi:hypothetical protein
VRILATLIFAVCSFAAAPPNNKYTIAAAPKADAVSKAFVQRLSAKGFVQRPVLDVQCCAIQIEIVTAASLTVRITLLDIDKQPAYTHVYTGRNATAIAEAAFADKDFLKTLSGS